MNIEEDRAEFETGDAVRLTSDKVRMPVPDGKRPPQCAPPKDTS